MHEDNVTIITSDTINAVNLFFIIFISFTNNNIINWSKYFAAFYTVYSTRISRIFVFAFWNNPCATNSSIVSGKSIIRGTRTAGYQSGPYNSTSRTNPRFRYYSPFITPPIFKKISVDAIAKSIALSTSTLCSAIILNRSLRSFNNSIILRS